ncbi:MAG: hypothetical protein GXO66_08775 [Euryarchaeota archaeon]|nr:hypothetical protein [Euryarchaeota archaeon]
MKAQISIEVALMTGIAILVIVSMVNLQFERFHSAREVGEAGEAKMVGTLLASAINNVYANGEGFQIHLSQAQLNFTQLGESTRRYGLGVSLPIIVNNSARSIVIAKNTSKTGGELWNVTVPIVTDNVVRLDPSTDYPEVTIRNNGTHVLIYAQEGHITTVG